MRKLSPILPALLAFLCLAQGQTIDFELKTRPESPVVFADAARAVAPGVPRRQFVTLKSESKKMVTGVILEQTASNGSKIEIVAIERVGIAIPPGAKVRVSIDVADILGKLQSGELQGRPDLSIVTVEFADGTLWTAPTGTGAQAAALTAIPRKAASSRTIPWPE